MWPFDEIAEAVEEVAETVVEVAQGAVGGVAAAVSEIPLVGDVVEAAAPFGGMIGTFIGGPVGGAIGGMVGDAFGGGGGDGGMFGFLDDAIGAIGLPLSGPIGDIAGDLMGGGSLIDAAGSLLSGGLGDLGGLAGAAEGLLGGDLGGLAGAAEGLLGGDFGGLLGQAGSVLGGLGLGDLGSAAQGIIGDCMPDLSDAGGWLGNLPDSIPALGDGFELPFGCGTFPSIPDLTGPIGAAGGGWLGQLAEQAGEVAGQLGATGGGSWFEQLGGKLEDVIATTVPDVLQPVAGTQDAGLPNIDDLIGQLPGVGEATGSVQDKLQQLAETGALGDALGNLSSNELTQLVGHLVNPIGSVIEAPAAATSGLADDFGDGLGTATATGGGAAADDLGLDVTAVGADAMAGSAATGDITAASTDSTFEATVDEFGGGMADAPPAPEMPAPAPEPESDFSQAIAQADAVEESFDSMFEGLE